MTAPDWWQSGVIYQVYPRSFQDSNGDGVGDLAGVATRLPYLAGLGIDAIWLSPFYPSPMADFGYDVSDYCAVDPLFGTLADFDRLVAEAHVLGLRIIVDLVPNHTAITHPWFVESRSSRDHPRRDWYIWRDGREGGPPNNWLSHFGGSAWTRDTASGQYYYHAYLSSQPDLNWRNPAVRAAIHDVMRFWLNRGVDGFRVDVMWHLMKDEQFRDNPPNPHYRPGRPGIERLLEVYSADRPDVHDVVAGLRQVVDEVPGRVLIGETYLPLERLAAYYGQALDGAHMPFNFHLLETPWTAPALRELINRYEAVLPPGAWPNWVLGNHDRPRLMGRLGEAGARLAALLLLTLRGTPTLYYGDEIGMPQSTIPADRISDPWGKSEPAMGRDPCRTPMAWSPAPAAGFTTGRPWLPLHSDWQRRNVAVMESDHTSLLTFYRQLIALRRRSAALHSGDYSDHPAPEGVLVFGRQHEGTRLEVVLNLSDRVQTINVAMRGAPRIVLSTDPQRPTGTCAGLCTLRPQEGLILDITDVNPKPLNAKKTRLARKTAHEEP